MNPVRFIGCLAPTFPGLDGQRLPFPLPAQQHNRSLFPTHNPTHRMRCLVRLTRCLAVPAVLYVVVKPNHATLIRARSVCGSSPPRRTINHQYLCGNSHFCLSLEFPIRPSCQRFVNFSIGQIIRTSGSACGHYYRPRLFVKCMSSSKFDSKDGGFQGKH
jgi:hypothetical protein